MIGLQGMLQHVDIMTAYRESIACRDGAFRAWHTRARAKAIQTSLVTARGKLRRQVLPWLLCPAFSAQLGIQLLSAVLCAMSCWLQLDGDAKVNPTLVLVQAQQSTGGGAST